MLCKSRRRKQKSPSPECRMRINMHKNCCNPGRGMILGRIGLSFHIEGPSALHDVVIFTGRSSRTSWTCLYSKLQHERECQWRHAMHRTEPICMGLIP